jgi:hypothetical protein
VGHEKSRDIRGWPAFNLAYKHFFILQEYSPRVRALSPSSSRVVAALLGSRTAKLEMPDAAATTVKTTPLFIRVHTARMDGSVDGGGGGGSRLLEANLVGVIESSRGVCFMRVLDKGEWQRGCLMEESVFFTGRTHTYLHTCPNFLTRESLIDLRPFKGKASRTPLNFQTIQIIPSSSCAH